MREIVWERGKSFLLLAENHKHHTKELDQSVLDPPSPIFIFIAREIGTRLSDFGTDLVR
jgi:hypothetical protein